VVDVLIYLKEFLSFFIAIIIGYVFFAYIPINLAKTTDELFFISCVSIAAIFIAVLFLLSYFKDFEKLHHAIRMNEKLPLDIRMLHFHKIITFDDKSLTDKSCNTHVFRELVNEIGPAYHEFRITGSSSYDVPDYNNITFKKNGAGWNDKMTRESTKFKLSVDQKVDSNFNPIPATKKIKSFTLDFPVDLKKGEKCNFEADYRSKAFEKVFLEMCDFTSLKSSRYIEAATIEIKLEGKMKEFYCLSQCLDRRDGEPIIFEILDESEQRMWYWEEESHKNFEEPSFTDNLIKWTIPNPKVGYYYRLYFTLKKNPKNLQSTLPINPVDIPPTQQNITQ
jgi:hypothetical protein